MITALLLLSFTILILLNVPIGVCLGGSSILALIGLDIRFDMIPTIFYASTSKFVLLAIPFFILGGNIMEKAGISGKLINMAQTLVGQSVIKNLTMSKRAKRCASSIPISEELVLWYVMTFVFRSLQEVWY